MVYRLFWITLVPLIRLYWRVRWIGRDNVPETGAIVASNHVAAIDPILICACFWRQVSWLAKVELVKTKRIAWFFRGAAVIPVDREAPDTSWIPSASKRMDEGGLFGTFPEGTRSLDGRVYRAHTGVARIAEASGRPVIPAAVVGSNLSHKKGGRFARPVPCSVTFGEPMYFEQREGETIAAAYHRFSDEVMDRVAEMLGAERVRETYSRERRRQSSG
jgi:1-acyl-sn-glycerol-3-phosphate acyltransferase